MSRKERKELSSKELLEKISLATDLPDVTSSLLDEDLDDLQGDLVPVLRERYRSLKLDRHTLHAGMAIGWKPGLQNRRWPSYGKPRTPAPRPAAEDRLADRRRFGQRLPAA